MRAVDGLQRPLGALRLSVTDRCNFRCGYCMPREVFGPDHPFLPRAELLSFEELARITQVFIGLGVTKVRLTGGEPLLRKDLPDLVRRLAGLPGLQDLALTTNGGLLRDFARPLREAGLRRVTVSLDTLRPERFAALADTPIPLATILEGLEAARTAGFAPVKLNCVLQRGVNEDEVLDLVDFARREGHTLRFIEFMDVGTANGWCLDKVVPARDVLARITERWPLLPCEESPAGRVAERWRYADGQGEIGLVASVTQPFCAGCDRARLSAEGRLFTCLFAAEGTDLKTALRNGATDADLAALVQARWARREDRYSELRTQATAPARRVEMHHIGG